MPEETTDVAALFARLKEELRAAGARGSDVTPAQVRLSVRDQAERLWPISAERPIVGKGGPVAGTELPCQVAPGKDHRVLLFTRPVAKKPGVREAYCVFLTPDPTPKAKQGDPFKRLPSDTSAHQGPEFSHAACVAITHAGKVLTDPDAVVRLVEARVKADPTRVSAAGHYAECGPEADDGDVHNLFVPADR